MKRNQLHNIGLISVILIGLILGYATELELLSLIFIVGAGYLVYDYIEVKEDLKIEKSNRKFLEEQLKKKKE